MDESTNDRKIIRERGSGNTTGLQTYVMQKE